MGSLYLSTGRKPSQLTRKMGRLLSLLLHCKFENRGKRSVDGICERAEKFGCRRVAFIYEKKGNPSSIEFFDGEKGWLPDIIRVLGVNIPERKAKKRIPDGIGLELLDDAGREVADLLALEREVEGESFLLEGKFSEKLISFSLGGEKVLELKIRLEKKME